MRQEADPKHGLSQRGKLESALDQPPNEVVAAEAATRTTLLGPQRITARFALATRLRRATLCRNLSRCSSKGPFPFDAIICYCETPLPNAQAEWRAARHETKALYASRVHSSALLGMRQEADPKPTPPSRMIPGSALDQPPNEVVAAEAATRTTLRHPQRTATRFGSMKSVR